MGLLEQQWWQFAKNSHSCEENFGGITTISAHKEAETSENKGTRYLQWGKSGGWGKWWIPFSSTFRTAENIVTSTKPLAEGAVPTGNWNFFRGNPCWRPWANHPRFWRTLHCRVAHAFNHVYVQVSLGSRIREKKKKKRNTSFVCCI